LTTTFSNPVERVARSIQRRQINSLGSGNCTQDQLDNIFDSYPSDCPSVNLSTGIVVLTDVNRSFSAFCTPQCNPVVARYLFECGFEASGELFIQICSTNANNERCYNLLNTLNTDAARVASNCPLDGSSCSSSCQSSILTYRNNSGCCVSVISQGLFNANNNYSVWVSCSVETPGFCTQSTVIRPGSGTTSSPTSGTRRSPTSGTTSSPTSGTTSSPTSGTTNTQYPLSKLFVGLLLVMIFILVDGS